jgi:hypothetical protein
MHPVLLSGVKDLVGVVVRHDDAVGTSPWMRWKNSTMLCTSVKEILHCVQNDKSRRDQKALGQEHGTRLGDAVGQAPLIIICPVFLSGVKDLVGVFVGEGGVRTGGLMRLVFSLDDF